MGDLCLLAITALHQQRWSDESSQQVQTAQLATSNLSTPGDRPCNPQPTELRVPEFSPVTAFQEMSPSISASTSTILETVSKSAKPQVEPAPLAADPSPLETTSTLRHQTIRTNGDHTLAATDPAPSSGSLAPQAIALAPLPEQPLPNTVRPASNGQLFRQRVAALRAGQTYTRLPTDSFRTAWAGSTEQPTYEQWIGLLNLEARAMARGQGSNRLTIILGDSISQWFPSDYYSRDRFWLNQGISGDTTGGILQRLSALDATRPDRIHIMAGINDLRRGITDPVIVGNLRQIVTRLHSRHPQTQIVLHSILPTQLAEISAERIQRLNQQIEAIATQSGIQFLDLTGYFADETYHLQPTLTTDGLHLSPRGYQVWEWAMRSHDASASTLTARYRAYD